ncbi:MAG TPA: hypothetical protein VLS45_07535 [Methylomicrobium sp.]|nr:hypothetical protein [Methylomicrobium sp.]
MPQLQDSIADAFAVNVKSVTAFYSALLEQEFRDLDDYHEGSIPIWSSRSGPLIQEAQLTVMDMANAIIDMQLGILLDGEYSTDYPDPSIVTGPGIRNGSSITDVYGRVFKPVWQGLGDGLPLDTAIHHGIERLKSMFDVDIERVIDHVSIERFANEHKLVGYRRVLTGSRNCALCILASTQVYHKRQLKGIHPNCKCKVLPVTSFEDISKTLRQDLIDEVHASIKERLGSFDKSGRAIDYRKVLFVREHGELGPILTFRNHHFTGPKGLKTPGE